MDQFGYLPNAEKIAVISDPQEGFNADDDINPSGDYQVRQVSDDKVVESHAVQSWNNGATHGASKDKVWWFDFSSVTLAGDYYIYDPHNDVRSQNFKIGKDVYKPVMKQALRSYFYQRSNYAKQPPYADARWADAASHESATRALLLDPNNPLSETAATQKDVSRGWYDAGDYNKYINNADGARYMNYCWPIKKIQRFGAMI